MFSFVLGSLDSVFESYQRSTVVSREILDAEKEGPIEQP